MLQYNIDNMPHELAKSMEWTTNRQPSVMWTRHLGKDLVQVYFQYNDFLVSTILQSARVSLWIYKNIAHYEFCGGPLTTKRPCRNGIFDSISIRLSFFSLTVLAPYKTHLFRKSTALLALPILGKTFYNSPNSGESCIGSRNIVPRPSVNWPFAYWHHRILYNNLPHHSWNTMYAGRAGH